MKLTTTTFVSVDGVVQGIGGPDEDRSTGTPLPLRSPQAVAPDEIRAYGERWR